MLHCLSVGGCLFHYISLSLDLALWWCWFFLTITRVVTILKLELIRNQTKSLCTTHLQIKWWYSIFIFWVTLFIPWGNWSTSIIHVWNTTHVRSSRYSQKSVKGCTGAHNTNKSTNNWIIASSNSSHLSYKFLTKWNARCTPNRACYRLPADMPCFRWISG